MLKELNKLIYNMFNFITPSHTVVSECGNNAVYGHQTVTNGKASFLKNVYDDGEYTNCSGAFKLYLPDMPEILSYLNSKVNILDYISLGIGEKAIDKIIDLPYYGESIKLNNEFNLINSNILSLTKYKNLGYDGEGKLRSEMIDMYKFYVVRVKYNGDSGTCCRNYKDYYQLDTLFANATDNVLSCDPKYKEFENCQPELSNYCSDAFTFNSDSKCRDFAVKYNDNGKFDTLASNYCKYFPDTEFCSCSYNKDLQEYDDPVTALLKENAVCWNDECKTKGFKYYAQTRTKCPDKLSLCSNVIDIVGDDNFIQKVDQYCNNKEAENNEEDDPIDTVSIFTNYLLYLLLIIIISIIIYIVKFKFLRIKNGSETKSTSS